MVNTTLFLTLENILNEVNHNNYIYVARNIIHKGTLTLEFASKSIGTDENITPSQKLEQLQELKECCRDSFKTQVEALISDEIQNQGIQHNEVIGKCKRNVSRELFNTSKLLSSRTIHLISWRKYIRCYMDVLI